ncbi:E3 ubiquitin-protein ligase TRIM32-like [Thrips palmi]|uniref:E3 ubiquitin-protein ligase TRIM32-like n=1 Tax=Thrips palmi TaxID=161013 RepID=A0A6P9A4W3_THRPL|nr:E3 ubiquitin-protein ligase TRIM32-like [Thrips palmi]
MSKLYRPSNNFLISIPLTQSFQAEYLPAVSCPKLNTKAMECHICMEDFDSTLRRPKCIIPCGHTVCQHCLEDLKNHVCPTCRKEFSGPVTSLPDNYAILNLVENKHRPKSPSSTSISTNKLWCRKCKKAATDECGDLEHTLCSLRKLRSEQAARSCSEQSARRRGGGRVEDDLMLNHTTLEPWYRPIGTRDVIII